MILIYGSEMCPDCRECKFNLDAYSIPYEYADITADLHALKDFLALRDREPVFDPCKENHSIGIPALIIDDVLTLDWEGFIAGKGYTVIHSESASEACSADRKGC